jgi:catechol-2,3-dioxygenase
MQQSLDNAVQKPFKTNVKAVLLDVNRLEIRYTFYCDIIRLEQFIKCGKADC